MADTTTIIDCSSGEREVRSLTAEEEDQRRADAEEAASREAEEAAQAQAVEDWKDEVRDATAAGDLPRLGRLLTGDEAGVPAAAVARARGNG